MSSVNLKSHYSLPSVLDSSQAEQLRKDLLEFQNSPLSIQSDAVERVSTPCLQVLLSAAHTWKSNGLEFSLDQPSLVLVESLNRLAIANEFRFNNR